MPSGDRRNVARFLILWLGQTVSLLGSNLTSFALGVWVYQRTGMATPYALTLACATVPLVLFTPLAGSLVDRWDRRKVMILSDAGAGLTTLAVALLILSGRLEVWHVYLATAASSSFGAFQWPAYTTAVPRLLPREHFGRGNGLIQLSQSLSQIAAPALGGVFLVALGLQGVVLIDFGTFLVSLAALMLIRIPEAARAAGEEAGNTGALSGVRVGLGYFRERPGLLAILVFICVANFLTGAVSALAPPLVLSFASPRVLGTILTVGGTGMLAGSLLMSAWGGPRRRVLGILGFVPVMGAAMIAAGLRTTPAVLGAAAFAVLFCVPVINGSVLTILQSKVEPAIHGRVFAVARAVSWLSLPLAYAVTGPLADYVFEPAMMPGGALASVLGAVLGTGPGRGTALVSVLLGTLTLAVSAAGYGYRRLRFVDEELADAPAPLETAVPGQEMAV